jgi:GDP-L-fucose synthase
MMSKFHAAKQNGAPAVELWGTGTPVREFMYIDDLADALVFLIKEYSNPAPINVGTGEGTMIRDLANMIKNAVGYEGSLVWDTERPDGMPKRMLDSSRLQQLGWEPKTGLSEGLARTYAWYRDTVA